MGGASAGMMLHKMISDKFGFRGEFQITESLSMCAYDRAVELDIEEAYLCGKTAVELAINGTSGVMVTLVRQPGSTYGCTTGTAPLSTVAAGSKRLPDEFIDPSGMYVSSEYLEYLAPLVGELPQYTNLSFHKAKK
jgi:6-phosphofructokinase 1